jgi:hypothetical protein
LVENQFKRQKGEEMAKEVEMLVGVTGIYVFYLLYGIVQERVYVPPPQACRVCVRGRGVG